jgi:hypothetical protein
VVRVFLVDTVGDSEVFVKKLPYLDISCRLTQAGFVNLETDKLMVVVKQQDRGVYTGDIQGQLEWNMQGRLDLAKRVIVGGGHGGPRLNSGRKVGTKSVDWKVYSKPGKKEFDKIKITNRNIQDFFSKASVSKNVIDQDKGELKNKDYTLSELFLNTFSKHVNNIICHKVMCSKKGCGGLAMHTGILPENLKIPPFLFLNFHLVGSPSYYHNDFRDSCVLKQNL